MAARDLKELWPGQREAFDRYRAELARPLTWWQTVSAIFVGVLAALTVATLFSLLFGVAVVNAIMR